VDPATGENKSLVIISPDYLKTTVQVRLRDGDTKEFINNDMTVKVFSNKKIIDFGGHYKNEFNVRNGILNFAIDPNEAITNSDPLSLRVVSERTDASYDGNITYVPTTTFLTLTNPSYKVLLVQQMKSIPNLVQSNSGIKPMSFSTYPYTLYVDGNEVKHYTTETFGLIGLDHSSDYWSDFYVNYNPNISYSNKSFKIKYNADIDSNLVDYNMHFYFNYLEKLVNKNGIVINYDIYNLKTESTINGDFKLEGNEDNKLKGIKVIMFNNEIKTCPTGINFSFKGLDNIARTELEYSTERTNINGETYVTTIGIAQLSKEFPIYNTGEIEYSKLSNKVTFANNSQFIIEPQTLDMGDETACGKTFNFDLIPRNDLTKYKIIIKAGCEGKNVSITPNLNTLFKAAGITTWEGVNFVAGSAILYLAQKGEYNFIGEYNGQNFNFNWSTDLTNLATMRNTTLAANTELKNITYTAGLTADKNKMITINLIFSESACPF